MATPQDSRRSEAPDPIPLAVWLQPDALRERLPPETVQGLVVHYSDAGDVVLTSSAETAAVARRLNRRTDSAKLATENRRTRGSVRRLPREAAVLAIVEAIDADDARDVAEALLPQLAAGGFLVLAVAPDSPARLGALVRSVRERGASYWQHIVLAEPSRIAQSGLTEADAGPTADVRRAHRDLLVFRQPAAAAEALREDVIAA